MWNHEVFGYIHKKKSHLLNRLHGIHKGFLMVLILSLRFSKDSFGGSMRLFYLRRRLFRLKKPDLVGFLKEIEISSIFILLQ